jgi:hypothetical protein
LKILAPSDNAKIKPHGHRLGMATWRTHAVAAHQKTRHQLAVAPAAAAQADIWADPEAARATQVASDEPEQQGAAVAAESAPSALLVGGRAVRVVSPDDANEIDLAADAPEVAANKGPRSDLAAAQPPEAETVAVAQAREPSAGGTSAWVAQLLAAIGGAMAAASVAWFLIGSAPQRTYD